MKITLIIKKPDEFYLGVVNNDTGVLENFDKFITIGGLWDEVKNLKLNQVAFCSYGNHDEDITNMINIKLYGIFDIHHNDTGKDLELYTLPPEELLKFCNNLLTQKIKNY